MKMKKNGFRFIAAVLIIAAVFLSVLLTVSAEEDRSIRIAGANLIFDNNVGIAYAVLADDCVGGNVKILVWDEETEIGNPGSVYAELTVDHVEIIGDAQYFVFLFEDISAKRMGDYFYAVPYLTVGGTEVVGETLRYSILQYTCVMKNDSQVDEKLKDLISTMLDYGAAAQIYAEYRTDELVSDDYCFASVTGGKFSDGYSTCVVRKGESVTVNANIPEGYQFVKWLVNGEENEMDNIIAVNDNMSITAVLKEITENETEEETTGEVTPGDISDPSEFIIEDGMLMAYNGNAAILMIPDGVLYITGATVFNDPYVITEIHIPATVEYLEPGAFEDCYNLKKIVYEDTEDRWLGLGYEAPAGCEVIFAGE